MKKISIISTLLLFIPLVAFATPVPDTGQTKCYDNSQEITCPNPGEPFYGQDAQYVHHPQSYTKLDAIGNDLPEEATEWVMVRDNITGLIWEVKQDRDNIRNYENPHDADNRYRWYDSNPETNGGASGIPGETGTEAFINALNASQFGGFEDWRMPAIKELAFIRNMNTLSPAIDTNYFLNTKIDSQYWSSTTRAGGKYYAWHVNFDNGSISISDKGIIYRYARAVRGSQQTQNLKDNGDGTITDTNTGFMWEQKTIENMYDTYTWQEALAFLENLILNNDGEWTSVNPNASGIKYDDWRLPNVNELQSLVNYNFYRPAIDPVFSNTAQVGSYSYWSSTMLDSNAGYAFFVSFGEGAIYPNLDPFDSDYYFVRAVRGCELIDDFDCDGILDGSDNCPNNYNPEQENSDEDNLGNVCDNCPNYTNPNQEDADHDSVGDVCDICPNDPFNDVDSDGICGDIDSCPENFNPLQEDTDDSGIADACNDALDLDDDEWEEDFDNCPGNYNQIQEDTYPPHGNGIGDVCDCESDFDCDGDVDGTDATTFKLYFGRNLLFYPCDEINPCRGDFDCDQDCDGTDASLFKEDFGRSPFNKPCPACVVGTWCGDYFSSSGCGSESGFSTGERIVMSQAVERVYYLKLPDDYNFLTPYPLIISFHGLGGNYTAYSEGYYDLQEVVGDKAILVYPNALPDDNNITKWDDSDLAFFDDLFEELKSNLCFDLRKVFAVGHSNGAGFTHTLGCKRGNKLRAIGPVSGSLAANYSECIGQVAVIQIQGANDTVTPPGMVLPTRDYWAAINSCKKEETHEGVDPSCEAYNDCDTEFPVQYCEHVGGHEWPDFAGVGIWNFFESLPEVAPSDEPGDGDVGNFGEGIINFKIYYPSDFEGTPDKLALALYPYGTTPPIYVAPSYILNADVPIGVYQFGESTEYSNIAINLSGVDHDDYTLSVTIYVAGSNYPIPTTGLDYQGFQNITINSTTITVEPPFELEFVQSF